MVQPRVLVDPIGDLREDDEILSSEVVTISRSSKKEAAVPHVTFGVLSMMTDAFGAPGNNLSREWRFFLAKKPEHGLATLMGKSLRPTN